MTEELKPCPSCDGEGIAHLVDFSKEKDGFYWEITCIECKKNGEKRKTREEAALAWNTRASDTREPVSVIWHGKEEVPFRKQEIVLKFEDGHYVKCDYCAEDKYLWEDEKSIMWCPWDDFCKATERATKPVGDVQILIDCVRWYGSEINGEKAQKAMKLYEESKGERK